MMTATAKRRMTVEGILGLPDDGVRRLCSSMRRCGSTARRFAIEITAGVMIRVGHRLTTWLDTESRFRAARSSVARQDSFYRAIPRRSSDSMSLTSMPIWRHKRPDDTTLFLGVPVLAVEVLSPNDTQEWIRRPGESFRS